MMYRELSQTGRERLYEYEGRKDVVGRTPDGETIYGAYLDRIAKPPVWTIYAGLTHGVHKGMQLTESEAERMLDRELDQYERCINDCVKVPLNQSQYDALVLWCYNVGTTGAKNSTLVRLLNKGRYDIVPQQLLRWVHSGGEVVPGLQNRRRKEIAMWLTPDNVCEGERLALSGLVTAAPVTESKETIRSSWTIKGVIGAGTAYAAEKFMGLVDIAGEAGKQFVDIDQTLTPWKMILGFGSIITTVLIFGSLAVVWYRRVHDGKEGR